MFVNYFSCCIFLNTLLVNILFSLRNILSKYLSSSSPILWCLEPSPTWCLNSHRKRVPTCFYLCILYSPNARVLLQSMNVVVAVFCPLYTKRSLTRPLSMKAQAPLKPRLHDQSVTEVTHSILPNMGIKLLSFSLLLSFVSHWLQWVDGSLHIRRSQLACSFHQRRMSSTSAPAS